MVGYWEETAGSVSWAGCYVFYCIVDVLYYIDHIDAIPQLLCIYYLTRICILYGSGEMRRYVIW